MNPETLQPNLVLRPAVIEDAQHLFYQCWRDRSLSAIQEFLERCLILRDKGRGLPLVAEMNEQVIGFGLLSKWGKLAEISDVIVHPDWRGHGIGTAIIRRLCDEANQLHIPVLEIGAANSNIRAIALYQRLGFVPVREMDLDLGHGLEPVTYLTMRLSE